jgi:hypothetical protein
MVIWKNKSAFVRHLVGLADTSVGAVAFFGLARPCDCRQCVLVARLTEKADITYKESAKKIEVVDAMVWGTGRDV